MTAEPSVLDVTDCLVGWLGFGPSVVVVGNNFGATGCAAEASCEAGTDLIGSFHLMRALSRKPEGRHCTHGAGFTD